METKDCSQTASTDVPSMRVRCGKGRHMLPVLKDLFAEKENLIEITSCNKEHYQYPGYHSSNHSNVLYYTPDVTQLPLYSESHFLWYDIQLSKSSTSKNKATIKIDGINEEVFYWMSKLRS